MKGNKLTRKERKKFTDKGVCWKCKSPLKQTSKRYECTNPECGVNFDK